MIRYYNIETESMEEVVVNNVYDLITIHDSLKESLSSVVDELKQKVQNNEDLPATAYNVLFENLDYENDSLGCIEFLKNLMVMEESKALPQLSAFVGNVEILIEKYARAMDNFFDSDLSDYMQPQVVYDPPETNCVFLWNFMQKMNLKDKENQEWLHNKIKEWKYKASEQFATIATNYKNDE
ncbi:hypothetical protein IJ674_00630, partial [bacterium]|nr:hypothetical protein [bacterium]